MILLSRALSSYFRAGVRRRGSDYFRSGRVRLGTGSESHVTAGVRGSRRYEVILRRRDRAIHASCTCPYFDHELCKHVWAVVLAADARSLLRGDGVVGTFVIMRERDAGSFDEQQLGGDDDEGDDVEGGDDGDGVYGGVEDGVDVELEPFDIDLLDDEPAWQSPRSALPTASAARRTGAPSAPRAGGDRTPDWRDHVARLRPPADSADEPRGAWPPTRELIYVIDIAGSRDGRGVRLDVCCRDRKKSGGWSKPKSQYLPHELLHRSPNAGDRHVLALLSGAKAVYGDYDYGYAGGYHAALPFRYRLLDPQLELILPAACETGRCYLRRRREDDPGEWSPLHWEAGSPWQFELRVCRAGEHYDVAGTLRRGAERMDLAAPLLLLSAGILFTRDRAMRFEHGGAFGWIVLLREQGSLVVPAAQGEQFAAELFGQGHLPALDLPEELRYEETRVTPRPRLAVKPIKDTPWVQRERVRGVLGFDYGGTVVVSGAPARGIVSQTERRVLLRDPDAERAAEQRLLELGFRPETRRYAAASDGHALELAASRLPPVVHELTAAGWHVEAEGKPYRTPGRADVRVSSGIDWFELHGSVEFGDGVAQLPELLAAARRGEKLVTLDDGSYGLLPEAWLAKFGFLAGLGEVHEDHLRFGRSQVGLLDALLAAQPEARCDEQFAQARAELSRFTGVEPAEPPQEFCGALRRYQKEGLGWLRFLSDFRFGGCLADDMGLGKTVQALALLEARRERRARADGAEKRRGNGAGKRRGKKPARAPQRAEPPPLAGPPPAGPSLVVMPKSLIFNWAQEAARFAPRLRVLDHTGTSRRKDAAYFADYDLILTTYGTLRNDIVALKDVRFDYVILDEAQAIKNSASAAAKAVRLLQADHRLALSGTPIENHLGELWSLFEFLNPGMLGTSSLFREYQERVPDVATRQLLSRALRPFLLRRTKEQVLADLPPKIEQTLYCEIEGKQRKLYDELRDHYRSALLGRIERGGIKRAKIQILEALLRLRQAANHPGLIDTRRSHESSAKLDLLLPRLLEVLDEGHKTLVFSQFTSLLAILRERLDHLRLPYEYLDGKTRNREARVTRFQTDPDCPLFLISLKAGGLGLNLTAAQYVFLLDPWWNPAVEAQAIDRTHRIGQKNTVVAYRLIARDTIEERVLELQTIKRELADAIIGADNALIRSLGKEELELLLT